MGNPSLFSFGRASREYLPDGAVSLRPQRGLVASPERKILSYRGLRGETIPIFRCRPASASHFESLSFRKPMFCEGCERCSQPFCLRGRRIYLRGPSNEKGTRQSRPSRHIGLQGRSRQRRERRAKRSQSRRHPKKQNVAYTLCSPFLARTPAAAEGKTSQAKSIPKIRIPTKYPQPIRSISVSCRSDRAKVAPHAADNRSRQVRRNRFFMRSSFDRERDRRYPNRRAFRARRQNG